MCYYLDDAELNNDPSNKFLLSPRLIERYAKDNGFSDVRFFGYMGIAGPLGSSIKYSNGKQPMIRNRGIFILRK